MSAAKKKSDPAGQEKISDEELVSVHADLKKDKHPPTVGFLRAPLVFVFVFGCLIFLCSIQLAHTTNFFQIHPPKETVERTPEEVEALRFERLLATGKKVYTSKCSSCHNPDGQGKDTFPPLVNSKWVVTDPSLIIKIVLKGLKGEIEVNGKKYGTSAAIAMPPQERVINNREIAAAVTYVRNAWGNQASEVTEAQVATIRDEVSGQTEQWIGSDLREAYADSFSGD